MDMIPLKLDSLPTEILQRIVSLGPCENILALSTVNRIFHRVCNDWLMYDAIIKNRNGHGGPGWQGPSLTGAHDISTWARYALADSKAAQITRWSDIEWIQCGPQLMTWCHPILYERNAKWLFNLYQNSTEDQRVPLIFCLTLKLMSQRLPDEIAPSSLLPARRRIHRTDPRRTFRHALKRPLKDRCLSNSIPDLYCVALGGLGILSILLREACLQSTVDLQPEAIPTTETTNFHNLMDMPLPFTPNSAAELQRCHLPNMSSKSFFEDGEWTGYSYTSCWSPTPHVHSPMRNIHFKADIDPARQPSHLLSAAGQDAIGQFSLHGRMEQESGKMNLNQRHTSRLGRRHLV
ncbi:MAG: hypothetical protein LQ352_004472 [Teloschistes flavicans]|nr:MAG: hypothetical protein LQ352_004472 [Teloschistes flavicans]